MLVSNVYKTLCRSRVLSYGGSLAHLNTVINGLSADQAESKESCIAKKKIVFSQSTRYYSSEAQAKPTINLPPLCDFPPALWPKFFNTLRNFFIINMVIKSRFDNEFKENDFMSATKKALYIVSSALACENYDRLEGLVTPEMIEVLRNKVSTLSEQQKELIVVQEDDAYLTFPYDVAVTYEDDNDKQRRFVEITVVHHYMQGFGRMKKAGESIPLNMFSVYEDRIFICNYRYFREFTEGVDSPWTLNVVNHFSPNARMLRRI